MFFPGFLSVGKKPMKNIIIKGARKPNLSGICEVNTTIIFPGVFAKQKGRR